MNPNTLIFILAVAAGALMTLLVRQTARSLGIVNNPNPIVPQHTKPTAYLGGVGVFLGIVTGLTINTILPIEHQALTSPLALSSNLRDSPKLIYVGTGGLAFLLFGLYDDIQALRPFQKLLGQFVIASVIVSTGVKCDYLGAPLIDSIVSAIWIVTVVNAVNFTDVCDGLVGTISATTLLTVAVLEPEIRGFCLLVSGSVIGFLFFNIPRASIFLGDAGSHLIGYILAIVGLANVSSAPANSNIAWMISLVGVPLFELVFITTIRVRRGLPWWKGSPDHFSLRMQQGGISRVSINLLSGIATMASVIIGHMYSAASEIAKFLIASGAVCFCIALSKVLMRWEVARSK